MEIGEEKAVGDEKVEKAVVGTKVGRWVGKWF